MNTTYPTTIQPRNQIQTINHFHFDDDESARGFADEKVEKGFQCLLLDVSDGYQVTVMKMKDK